MLNVNGNNVSITGYADTTVARKTAWPGVLIRPLPSSKTEFLISSSSASDTYTGTGARTVRVTYLNSGLNQKSVDLILAGQTPVLLGEPASFVQSVEVTSAGTSRSNVGVIYCGSGAVAAGVPTIIYDLIPIAYGASQSLSFTVPLGKKFLLKGLHVDSLDATLELTTYVVKLKILILQLLRDTYLLGLNLFYMQNMCFHKRLYLVQEKL
jgi:hypothetical protein